MKQLTDYYCDQCRQPLSKDTALDGNHAWCSHCESAVVTSYFRFPAWMIGAAFLTVTYFAL